MIATFVITILAIILLTLYYRDYKRRLGKKEAEIIKCNKELATLLQQGHMLLWIYDITTGIYSWMDDEHAQMKTLQPREFSSRYPQKVSQHINQAIQELIRGTVETKTLRFARTTKNGSKRYYSLDMSLIRRHQHAPAHMIAVSICVRTVTRKHACAMKRCLTRRWSIWCTTMHWDISTT